MEYTHARPIVRSISRFVIRALALFTTVFVSLSSNAQSWVTHEVIDARGSGGDLGRWSSMAVIGGKPAIVSYDQLRERVMWSRAQDADGAVWSTPVAITAPGLDGIAGTHLSLLEVNGNPAFAYYVDLGSYLGRLMYIRANDMEGTSWGTPVMVDDVEDPGQCNSMAIVNGRPAISYYRAAPGLDVNYVRANDSDGSSWGSPQMISAGGNALPNATSLVVVNGNPAVAYGRSQAVYYMRATDADGEAWGSPISAMTGLDYFSSVSMCVAAGVPWIACIYDDTEGCFVRRATDADGTAWTSTLINGGTPSKWCRVQEVDGVVALARQVIASETIGYSRATDAVMTSYTSANIGVAQDASEAYTSFAVVNGHPAVAHYEYATIAATSRGQLAYVRAQNSVGSSPWNAPLHFTAPPAVGEYVSQCFVEGNPALAYYDLVNRDLRYIRATDPLGTSWGTSLTIDSLTACGMYASMLVVNGNPAIAYFDSTLNLKYVRANDALGTTWGAPVLVPATNANTWGNGTSMAIIAGRPAIAFTRESSTRYCRALDVNGDAWPASQGGVNTGSAGNVALIELGGLPAIICSEDDLRFRLALDVDGTAWNNEVVVDAADGWYLSAAVVNGNPAVAYYQTGVLKFARGNNATGTGWGVFTVDNTGGIHPSLAVVDGTPVITYSTGNGAQVKLTRGNNPNGTSWGPKMTIATMDYLWVTHLNLRTNGSMAGISGYDPAQGYAFYLAGAECALITPAPVNTTPPENLSICYGESTTLSASGEVVSWYSAPSAGLYLGSGNSLITAPLTANTTFYAQDSACYLTARTLVGVAVAAAINTNVSVSGNSLTAVANAASYQWVDCNNGFAPIANATEQTYHAPVSGSYAVVVTVGACADTSACQAIITMGVEDNAMSSTVSVYPVPARDELWITSSLSGQLYIELMDMTGRAVVQLWHNGDRVRVNVDQLPRGCYAVAVGSNGHRYMNHVLLH